MWKGWTERKQYRLKATVDEAVIVDIFQASDALFQLGRESGGKHSGIWATYQLDRISLVIIPQVFQDVRHRWVHDGQLRR